MLLDDHWFGHMTRPWYLYVLYIVLRSVFAHLNTLYTCITGEGFGTQPSHVSHCGLLCYHVYSLKGSQCLFFPISVLMTTSINWHSEQMVRTDMKSLIYKKCTNHIQCMNTIDGLITTTIARCVP